MLLPLAGGRVEAYPLASLVRTAFTGAMVAMGFALLRSEVTGQIMNVDTVLLNTVGVALVHVLVVPAVRARLRRRADRAGRPRSPGTTAPRPRPRRSTGSGSHRGATSPPARGHSVEDIGNQLFPSPLIRKRPGRTPPAGCAARPCAQAGFSRA
ncbi:hypothetical protein SVIO_049470 [Streptomyces violaceusniger]|uniref:VanZ-like domain-containing protein n=1 Tax=Streptomyces violaceusniger TaxID=68280 RepID=A0A4D4L1K3_STRVO|nr:hypothetical protein SVIO_049470 [Streptomyces violaceusniger]